MDYDFDAFALPRILLSMYYKYDINNVAATIDQRKGHFVGAVDSRSSL